MQWNRRVSLCLALLGAFAARAVVAQDSTATTAKTVLQKIFMPTSQDVFLPITSVEWGAPDRWSFTARYVHMFDAVEVRDTTRSLNNLTVTLSPGTAGGRLGLGYENIFDSKKGRRGTSGFDVALLSEARVVLLRTWGSPLTAPSGGTFAGGELRTSLVGVCNIGVGYYAPYGGKSVGATSFWGVHAGIGI